MVSIATFQSSTRGAEVYMLEALKMVQTREKMESNKRSILVDYPDLQGLFNKEASNQLPEHGASNMKIDFKEGQEPRNMGLWPMSPMELDELW